MQKYYFLLLAIWVLSIDTTLADPARYNRLQAVKIVAPHQHKHSLVKRDASFSDSEDPFGDAILKIYFNAFPYLRVPRNAVAVTQVGEIAFWTSLFKLPIYLLIMSVIFASTIISTHGVVAALLGVGLMLATATGFLIALLRKVTHIQRQKDLYIALREDVVERWTHWVDCDGRFEVCVGWQAPTLRLC